MLDQAQVLYHLGVQQADRVAGGRVAEAGVEFLGDRGATEDGTALEYAHGEPRLGEVAGAGEAVVAAADDDHIEAGLGVDLDKFTVYKSSALILL